MDDPDAGDWSYTYDAAGNQTSVTDALGDTVHTVYDELNRPRERREDNPLTGTLLAKWEFDAEGQLGLLDETIRYTPAGEWHVNVAGYDARNRPTSRTWDVPASLTAFGDYTVAYEYDLADRQTKVTYPAVGGLPLEEVNTTFDAAGLPDTMAGATSYVHATTYDDRGRPSTFGFGPAGTAHMGKHWEYDHNQQLRLTEAAGTGGTLTQSRTLTYDQAGNVTERNTTLAGAAFKECFKHDQRHRLTTAYTTTPATACTPETNKGTGAHPYNHTYTYTVDGNLDARTEGATNIDYTYPAGGPSSVRPHAPTDVGSDDYTWNANGNQATRTVGGQLHTFTWDTEHLLSAVDDPDGDSSFTYDAHGARLLRQTPAGTTLYIEGHEITAPTGGGPLTAVRSYGFGGQPVATRTPTGVDYIVIDNQGSLEQTIPAGAATAEHTRTYFPYGKVRTGGQPDTDHTWIGQIEDDSTALQYLNARYYDPSTGVFTAPDPLHDPGRPRTLNPYGYGINNPTTNSDPSGDIVLECTMQGVDCRSNGRSGPTPIPPAPKSPEQKRDENVSGDSGYQRSAFDIVRSDALICNFVYGNQSNCSLEQARAFDIYASYLNGSVSQRACVWAGHAKYYAGVSFCAQAHGGTDFGNLMGQMLIEEVPLLAIAAVGGVGRGATSNSVGGVPAPTIQRNPRDIAVNPSRPDQLSTNRSIGRPSHNQALQQDILNLPRGARDIRVNQQQVNAAGQRVGINRPDLQYTIGNQRYYIEYEGLGAPRGQLHTDRILSNDPTGQVTVKEIP